MTYVGNYLPTALILGISIPLALLIVEGVFRFLRFKSYGFVVAAIILAMLPWSIHCLIGLPAGIWAFWTLERPEIKAAFAANLHRRKSAKEVPKETNPGVRKARAFWRSFYSVFLSSPR
jgi:hypothetical protein